MRTSIVILSALAASATAHVKYETVDVTVTSCAAEVTDCPGKDQPYEAHQTSEVLPVDEIPTTSGHDEEALPVETHVPEVPETPSYDDSDSSEDSMGDASSPSTTGSDEESVPGDSEGDHDSDSDSEGPASTSGASVPEETSGTVGEDAEGTGALFSAVPYPTGSPATLVSSSTSPMGTDSPIEPAGNGTGPDITPFIGAASFVSASFSATGGLAAVAAFFLA